MNDLWILRVEIVERVEQLIGPGQNLIGRNGPRLRVIISERSSPGMNCITRNWPSPSAK